MAVSTASSASFLAASAGSAIRLADQGAVLDRRGVDRDLVGPGPQQAAGVFDRADSAAHRDRHEADVGGARDDVEDGAAALVAGGDVEEHQLVRPRGVIGGGLLDRVAGVAQGEEPHALDHAPVLDVQAGYHSDLQHQAAAARASSEPIAPV
jgi:hypothetical protein